MKYHFGTPYTWKTHLDTMYFSRCMYECLLPHYYVRVLSISSWYLVSFPFLEPLIRQSVRYFDARKAADFLEQSAAKIIESRKVEPDDSAKVNLHL